nr:response regulator [Bacteroidota bacterium]
MNILIVEDEKPAATRLVNMLKKAEPNAEIVGMTDGVESTLNFLDQNGAPDLVFMDIHLADGSGLEIFRHYSFDKTGIVFCTAYDQYAIEAFKVHALYYLLKPIKEEDLIQALSRYQEFKEKNSDYRQIVNKLLSKQNQDKRFLIRMGQSLRLV